MNVISLRKNTRNSIIALTVSVTLFGASTFHSFPVSAMAVVCTNCASWKTQLLEHTTAVSTAISAADQVRDSIAQALSFPDQVFRDITADLQQVVDVYNDARSLGRDLANLEKQFREQFKGYEDYIKSIGKSSEMMPERYEQWAQSGLDNARTAMEAAGINTSSFDDEKEMLDRMVSRSSSASGRLQALQAGNEIAAQSIQQLQKLRDMMQTQVTLQANYMATQTERQAIDDAFNEMFFSVRPKNTGRDKEY